VLGNVASQYYGSRKSQNLSNLPCTADPELEKMVYWDENMTLVGKGAP
jgi:hypothetical protein